MTLIAIASCSKIQDWGYQPGWRDIEKARPDLLVLLGDLAYMAQEKDVHGVDIWNHPHLDSMFKRQFNEKHFRSLIEKVPYMAVWDDHDFGPNDSRGANAEGLMEDRRDKSRRLFKKHLAGAVNNNWPHVHCAWEVGDVKVILLDCRYYRTDPHVAGATILGDEQEAWLAKELVHQKRFTVVGCGIPLGGGPGYLDGWGAYPEAQQRLVAMLRSVPRLLYVAGDAHKNRFYRREGFFEVISSGIGRREWDEEKGRKVRCDNLGLIRFGAEHVDVVLRGNRRPDRDTRRIDVATWRELAPG